MSLAVRYGARRIEGLHNEDHRFPYATLASQLDPEYRDRWAATAQRQTPFWDRGDARCIGQARSMISRSAERTPKGR